MELANTAFAYLSAAPSNEHFGMSNTELIAAALGIILILVLFKPKKK